MNSNVAQLVTEIGRLHMENLELRSVIQRQQDLIDQLAPAVPPPVDEAATVEPAEAATDGPD